MPADEEVEIQSEAEKVAEKGKVHDPVRHPFKYPTDKVTSINKIISISIRFSDGMRIAKRGISRRMPTICTRSSYATDLSLWHVISRPGNDKESRKTIRLL